LEKRPVEQRFCQGRSNVFGSCRALDAYEVKERSCMARVTVYQWEKYDVKNDAMVKSRRWATREAVEWAHGVVIERTAVDIEESTLSQEISGMTARGFNPHASKVDVQVQVRL
jgi:hypothetical protein